jgi:hypothetical protein
MIDVKIDDKELRAIGAELGATEAQIRAAYNRALNRAAGTIRRLSSQGLRSELGLRNAAAIRRRLRDKRIKGKGGLAGRELWFGTNDMAFGAFKGKPAAGPGGVSFRGRTIAGAFIAKGKVFKRQGAAALPIDEQTVPVEEEMSRFIEAEILPEIGEIVMRNFIADLRARTSLGVGR